MSIAPEKTIKAVEKYFKELEADSGPYTKWAKRKNPLTDWDAIKFLIHVMLDQMQLTDRASAAKEEFVEKRDKRWSPETFWEHFAEMKIWDIKKYCKFKPEGDYKGAYAGINANKFPWWLRDNAEKIVKEYGGRVENIWEDDDLPTDNEEKIKEIHRRFVEFGGIGENLANMATFSLVKDRGYAGGRKSQKFLRIKFDTHVKRVVEKAILAGNKDLGTAEAYVQELNEKLDSPADFDQMLFKIGQEYCQYDVCSSCPINKTCNTYQLRKNKELSFEYEENDVIYSNLYTMFIERNLHCFEKFSVLEFEMSYFSKNEEGIFEKIFDCLFTEDDKCITPNNTGIRIENRDLECTLRLVEEKRIRNDGKEHIDNFFKLKIDKLLNLKKECIEFYMYPYVGENEIIFKGEKNNYKIYIKLEMVNKDKMEEK